MDGEGERATQLQPNLNGTDTIEDRVTTLLWRIVDENPEGKLGIGRCVAEAGHVDSLVRLLGCAHSSVQSSALGPRSDSFLFDPVRALPHALPPGLLVRHLPGMHSGPCPSLSTGTTRRTWHALGLSSRWWRCLVQGMHNRTSGQRAHCTI